MMIQYKRRRRSTAIALLSIAILASLCLNKLVNYTIPIDSDTYLQQLNHQKRKLLIDNDLLTTLHTNCNYHNVNGTDGDYNLEAANAANITYEIGRSLLQVEDTKSSSSSSTHQYQSTIQNYTLTDALNESTIYEHTFCLLLYDPPTNKFLILYSHDHRWENSNRKLWKAIRNFTYLLRQVFPNRFTKDSKELVIPIGSGDYPQLNKFKLPHLNGIAPVLQFGSVFRDTNLYYKSMIPMPMPEPHHLYCFSKWVASGEKKRVCNELRELEFSGEFDSLIPQVVWRGTDFGYLQSLQPRPSLIKPYMNSYVDPAKDYKTRRAEAIRSLNDQFDKLLPRWKGVALTADAELQAGEDTSDSIPWANMKLSSYIFAGKSPTMGSVRYEPWESVSVATGEHMSLDELAKYKYHIDLGGGGGTTWSGTIEKLGMPGLLFHHVTPMKDYIHDYLIPWKHYIPVSVDLKDLKEKFYWAESHPVEAKRIADASTDFMRELSTPRGFEQMFEQAFVEPLQRVIDSYRPVASINDGMSWRELFQSMGKDCHVWPVMECTGMDRSSCTMLTGGRGSKAKKMMNWIEHGHMTVHLSDTAKALIEETNPEQQPREMPYR